MDTIMFIQSAQTELLLCFHSSQSDITLFCLFIFWSCKIRCCPNQSGVTDILAVLKFLSIDAHTVIARVHLAWVKQVFCLKIETVSINSLQIFPQCLSSRRLPPLQSAASLQVSTLTEPHSSGGKMERSFMRRWTTERSSPTTMEPSRWVLTWTFHQSHLKTGRGTTVCFSSLVWRRKSSPNWRKIGSGPTGVRVRSENVRLYLFMYLLFFSFCPPVKPRIHLLKRHKKYNMVC